VTHLEPKVDVCDRHYVFDAQPPAGSNKPLVFTPTGHCPVYEVPQNIAGPALEKQRNDDLQFAQLTQENVAVAPVKMGTDGGMNRVFVTKLETTAPVYDNEGHLHAPPVHPGMPAPTLSGPRENPDPTTVASTSGGRGLFGNLFANKSSAPPAQVASADANAQDHSSWFGNLFKPKKDAAQPPPAQGAVLAGLRPSSEPRKTETAKVDPQISGTQTPAAQVAETPKLRTRLQQDKTQQDANATSPPANSGGLMKGAQPVVPTGSFDGRWAGLQ